MGLIFCQSFGQTHKKKSARPTQFLPVGQAHLGMSKYAIDLHNFYDTGNAEKLHQNLKTEE